MFFVLFNIFVFFILLFLSVDLLSNYFGKLLYRLLWRTQKIVFIRYLVFKKKTMEDILGQWHSQNSFLKYFLMLYKKDSWYQVGKIMSWRGYEWIWFVIDSTEIIVYLINPNQLVIKLINVDGLNILIYTSRKFIWCFRKLHGSCYSSTENCIY